MGLCVGAAGSRASVEPWRWRTAPSWLREVVWPSPSNQRERQAMFLEDAGDDCPSWVLHARPGNCSQPWEILPWIRIKTQEGTLRHKNGNRSWQLRRSPARSPSWDPAYPQKCRDICLLAFANNGVGFPTWILADITFSTRGCWILCYQCKSGSSSLIISLGYFRKQGTTKSRALFVRLCIHLVKLPSRNVRSIYSLSQCFSRHIVNR